MKKIILLALAAVMIAGCSGIDETNVPSEKTSIEIGGWEARIYVLDSCEYVRLGHGITHKGNCKFCEQRRQKELEELIDALKKE